MPKQQASSNSASKVSNKDQLSSRQLKKLQRADKLIHQRGHFKQAERLLNDIEQRLRPPYPSPLLQVKGALQLERKRYAEARELFQEVWNRDRDNVVANYNLGRIARKVNRPELALAFFKIGLEHQPDHQHMQVEYVQSLLELGRIDEAEAHIERHRSKTPDNPHFLQLTAEVKRRSYLLPEAVDYYRQSLEELIKLAPPGDKSAADAEETFDVERHEDTLWELLAQLKKAGVQAFPAFGTLLGLVRDGQLLPFDKDVDICIPFNQMPKAGKCLAAHGWKEVKNSFGMVSPRAFTNPQKRLSIDLFALSYDPQEKVAVTGFIMPKIPFDWNYLLKFPGMDLQVNQRPHGAVWELKDPVPLLESLYGKGWKEPDPYFATFGGEPGLVSFSYLTQCYAYIRLYKYWTKGSFKKMRALVCHMLRHQPGDALLEQLQSKVEAHLEMEEKRRLEEAALEEKESATVH
ncbi:tetratricopeptide repeat protein [Vreelandella aquamarina]|uniref:tetratricopeptide repeat protein n=1 Tax=Vreelandella aquamarina TaxID=77097 RepID=UPI00384C275C